MHMKITQKVSWIREQVKDHGNYRLLAVKASVGYEWLTKFASGAIDNPTIRNVDKLEDFFTRTHEDS